MNEFIGRLLVSEQRVREKEASGWVVLVLDHDTDPPTPVSTYGPCATPEAALIEAGKFDASPHTGTNPADGEAPWSHVVLPLFAIKGEE
jgi:hypothetical protein